MKKRLALLGAISLVGIFAIAVPTLANNGASSRTYGTSSAKCNDGTVTASPDVLWPPNHKMVDITVSYAENSGSGDGDHDNISLSDFTVSELDTGSPSTNGDGEGPGSGQPGGPKVSAGQQGADYVAPSNSQLPPAVPDTQTWSTIVQIRSERAGTNGPDAGRLYSITVTCHDQGGLDVTENAEQQKATVHVCVPHDQSSDTRGQECPAVIGG